MLPIRSNAHDVLDLLHPGRPVADAPAPEHTETEKEMLANYEPSSVSIGLDSLPLTTFTDHPSTGW